VAVRYTSRLSGVDSIAVMLLDVLSGLEELRICTAYRIDGKETTRFPGHVDDLRRIEPVYETLPGWREEIADCRRFDELPANARAYLGRVSKLVGQPIGMISVGREREQTIALDRQ
jgi:adenylosuccinate synthase